MVRQAKNLRGYLQHLTPRDLSGAAAEMRKLPSGGQHLKEVKKLPAALGIVGTMKSALANPELGGLEREAYSRMLGIASRALDRAEDVLSRAQ